MFVCNHEECLAVSMEELWNANRACDHKTGFAKVIIEPGLGRGRSVEGRSVVRIGVEDRVAIHKTCLSMELLRACPQHSIHRAAKRVSNFGIVSGGLHLQ